MKQGNTIDPAKREEVRHGVYIFPLQKYHTVLDQLHPAVTAHWHEESEFTYISQGGCRYHISLEDQVAEAGDLLFIPPLTLHAAVLLELMGEPELKMSTETGHDFPAAGSGTAPVSMESDTFVFHLNFLGGNSADICSMRYLTPLQNQELSVPILIKPCHGYYGQVLSIFKEVSLAYAGQEAGYELEIKSLLLRLLSILIKHGEESGATDASPSPAGIEKIRTVLTYIEENYGEPLTVEKLAGLCYFSKYHFMRFFKQHVGMTCVEYINNLRLEKALSLFEQGNSSILDVSLTVGFRNLSYFHRAFLKKYHITPGTFLRYQEENQEKP